MLQKIFRTKEGKIAAIIMAFTILIIISSLVISGYKRKKDYLEQAVMAENYLNSGKYEQAVEAYTKVLSMKGSDKKLITIGLAEAYAGLDEYDQALKILRAFYIKTPDIKVKEKIEEITSRKTDYEFSQIISKAEVFFSNKEYEKAISEYEKAKQIKSKDAISYKKIAEAYLHLGEYEKAREEVLEGQEITGDDSIKDTLDLVNSFLYREQYDALMTQAEEYILQENYKDGEKTYQEAIKLLPNESDAYIRLADIYISQGKHDEAIRLLSSIINSNTDDQELTDVYMRAKESKSISEEKSNIVKLMVDAIKKRNYNELVDIMTSSFFIENIAEETEVYYNLRYEVPADDDNTRKLTDGLNLIIYDQFTLYYGDIQNGRKNGNGLYLAISENREDAYSYFEGEWNRNLPNGFGRYIEIESYTDDKGYVHEKKTMTEGNYSNGLENGNMTKYFYEDNREISSLSYQTKDGVPIPLSRNSISKYPALEAGYYIIGEMFFSGSPSGEYYSVKSGTVWGISGILK